MEVSPSTELHTIRKEIQEFLKMFDTKYIDTQHWLKGKLEIWEWNGIENKTEYITIP